MPRVLNKRSKNIPADAVYIGRPTKWGNPYTHLEGTLAKYKVENRQAAVDAFKKYLDQAIAANPQILETIKRELGGKDLVCWCAPLACHGDYLIQLANN